MQGSTSWTPPGGTLGEILENTRKRVPSLDRGKPGVSAVGRRKAPSLKAALRRDTVAVIAELKRRSPSKGVLNSKLDAAEQARAFEQGGAAAISVLTEPDYFGGSLDDLRAVARATSLPVLKKDFHIDPAQLAEAETVQATAILLIARALPPADLRDFIQRMKGGAVEAVVEVRTEQELERALEAGAEIIGVNSRNLETLEVDERVPQRLVPRIPSHVVAIWESGVRTVDDVRRAADSGADAVLVGSALSRAANPEALVQSLSGVERKARNA